VSFRQHLGARTMLGRLALVADRVREYMDCMLILRQYGGLTGLAKLPPETANYRNRWIVKAPHIQSSAGSDDGVGLPLTSRTLPC
jgi:hypothetical protein